MSSMAAYSHDRKILMANRSRVEKPVLSVGDHLAMTRQERATEYVSGCRTLRCLEVPGETYVESLLGRYAAIIQGLPLRRPGDVPRHPHVIVEAVKDLLG